MTLPAVTFGQRSTVTSPTCDSTTGARRSAVVNSGPSSRDRSVSCARPSTSSWLSCEPRRRTRARYVRAPGRSCQARITPHRPRRRSAARSAQRESPAISGGGSSSIVLSLRVRSDAIHGYGNCRCWQDPVARIYVAFSLRARRVLDSPEPAGIRRSFWGSATRSMAMIRSLTMVKPTTPTGLRSAKTAPA